MSAKPSLIVLGTTNQFTFANSIVVANAKSQALFGRSLETIYVMHSAESQRVLGAQEEWTKHLAVHGIGRECLTEKLVEFASEPEAVERFVDHIGMIVKSARPPAELIVDLTNGTTLQKTLLSVAAYVLSLPHQFLIDIVKLSKLTQERGFLPLDVLLPCYIGSPDPTPLDQIAHLNLSEVIRYRTLIDQHTARYRNVDPKNADTALFRENLERSIELKMEADHTEQDKALYRIVTASLPASLDVMVGLLVRKSISTNDPSRSEHLTFGERLGKVREALEENRPDGFDLDFFRMFSDFMLYLRNSATHPDPSGQWRELERFKADLCVKMAFPFIEFYTNIVYPALTEIVSGEGLGGLQSWHPLEIGECDSLFFGLDGDDTGAALETAFLISKDEGKIREVSRSISSAIREICKFIRNNQVRDPIIFEAGDDIVFKGSFSRLQLEQMQRLYREKTNLTCSIGYGRSLRELHWALKLAKTQHGKGAIMGVEFR